MRRTAVNSIVGRIAVSILVIVFAAGFVYAAEQEGAGFAPPPESQGDRKSVV